MNNLTLLPKHILNQKIHTRARYIKDRNKYPNLLSDQKNTSGQRRMRRKLEQEKLELESMGYDKEDLESLGFEDEASHSSN